MRYLLPLAAAAFPALVIAQVTQLDVSPRLREHGHQ